MSCRYWTFDENHCTPRKIFVHLFPLFLNASIKDTLKKMQLGVDETQKEYVFFLFMKRVIWVFPKIGVPQNGWFTMEHPIKMDDFGVPYFRKYPYIFQIQGFLANKTFKFKKRRPSTGAEDSFRQCRNHHQYDCTMAYFGPVGWEKGKGTLSTCAWAGWKGWLWKRFFLTGETLVQKLISGIDWIFVQKATAVFMFHCCWRKYHGVSYDWSPRCFQTQWLVHVKTLVSQVGNPTDLAFPGKIHGPQHYRCFFFSPFSVNSNISNFICAKVWIVFGPGSPRQSPKNGF